MSLLPKIEAPLYTTKLPISELTIKFRPYNVKEQKLLAMAKESSDTDSLVDTILQIEQNCCLSDVDISELPLTDVEYFLYQLRARSDSELLELKYKCENTVEEGKKCNNIMHYDLNLITELEVVKPDVSPIIQIDDKVGIKLRYSRFEKDNVDVDPSPEKILEIIAKNVEFIYDENSAYSAKDVSVQEIVNWVGELPPEKYVKIEEFFANEPKIIKKLDIKCNKCGYDHHVEVKDIFDFFI